MLDHMQVISGGEQIRDIHGDRLTVDSSFKNDDSIFFWQPGIRGTMSHRSQQSQLVFDSVILALASLFFGFNFHFGHETTVENFKFELRRETD